jgi:TonB family protein
MKNLLIILSLFLFSGNIYAQLKVIKTDTSYSDVLTVVDVAPTFPGGDEKLYEFLGENMIYPAEAKEKGIEGIVYVNFIVEKDGSLSNARILRDIGGGCGEEVLRVVSIMPPWNPGKQKGEVVRVNFNFPVKLSLSSHDEEKDTLH